MSNAKRQRQPILWRALWAASILVEFAAIFFTGNQVPFFPAFLVLSAILGAVSLLAAAMVGRSAMVSPRSWSLLSSLLMVPVLVILLVNLLPFSPPSWIWPAAIALLVASISCFCAARSAPAEKTP